MEALEREVFYRINQELVAKYKKETTELWRDVLSLQETTNQLQAQLYDV
jgi:hypothetical protein